MSNLDRAPAVTTLRCSTAAPRPVQELFEGRVVPLGESTQVRRLLPNLGRRLVGAWCFVDHYGPDDIGDGAGMQVPPHPHLGLQTVSWLLAGEVHHRDSLGSDQLVRPGALGLMTSGAGIAHAEHSPGVPAGSPRSPGDFVGPGSPGAHPALLHGVQLWVALPEVARNGPAAWDYHAALPVLTDELMTVTLILGSLAGSTSPGTTHTALVGADVQLGAGADGVLPLEPDFEHAVLTMDGSAEVDGVPLTPGTMLYLGSGRRELSLRTAVNARLLLVGGEPFDEDVLMWWNFVGRSHDEIAEAREQWAAGQRFGTVRGAGDPLAAPPLPPGRLKPGGATR